MQKAIRKYLKKEAERIDSSMGKDYINQTFDMLDSEIDKAKRREIKRARRKKLGEWKRIEKMNCGHNKKKRLKGRSRR
ncbi:hypothetical protein ES695_08230 [Candidatus Atribacteria bacterium 1244-E10-H5-B2]|nr:MAG: hypothetical protein ES695_08230 [Candidatus Atribacteria bacterium 1244-E10-H5-B2]